MEEKEKSFNKKENQNIETEDNIIPEKNSTINPPKYKYIPSKMKKKDSTLEITTSKSKNEIKEKSLKNSNKKGLILKII